jgi:hypothetical protein
MTTRILLRQLTALLLCAGLAGCAIRWNPLATDPSAARGDPGDLDARGARLELELGKLGLGPQTPQCERACGLTSEICTLAGKVCSLSDRHPGDEQLRVLCERGLQRCQRCSAQLPPACACQRPGKL